MKPQLQNELIIMKITLVLLLITLLLSCVACNFDNKQAKEVQPYVISKIDSTFQALWKTTTTPPPHPLFYGDYNFIVDESSDKVFLHKKKHLLRFCGTGVNFSKPDFINLSPEDFVPLTNQDVDKYLADTLTNLGDRQTMVVASLQDTVKMKEAHSLIDYLLTARKIIRFNIRMVTEEEIIVLNHKKQNKPYSADSIQWSENFSVPFALPQVSARQ